MSAYHQMGHNSTNLLAEEQLSGFQGAVLSPVNEDEDGIIRIIDTDVSDSFEFIFDPQLYYPKTEMDKLLDWSYFPEDVDTVDQSNLSWWQGVNDQLVITLSMLDVDSVCSPAVVPRAYSANYYDLNRLIAEDLRSKIDGDVEVLDTLLVKMDTLAEAGRAEEIASIVTKGKTKRVYLIFVSDTEPRREISVTDEIKGAIKLVSLLEASGIRVLVGCTSSDILLWKFAGATDCATGKFFNLRRFTPSRFEPSSGGGGQLPYWFEETLFGYLREADLIRVRNADLLSHVSLNNPFSAEILDIVQNGDGTAWLGLSWRFYMYWFMDFESRFSDKQVNVESLLSNAEQNWVQLEDDDILMEEVRNNGAWIRPWRIAIKEA